LPAEDLLESGSKVLHGLGAVACGRARTLLRAAIGHAIVFPTWHSLVREQGLSDRQAVEVMHRLAAAG